MKKTKFYNKQERSWVLIDAKDKVLGRLATRVAKILQGKDKATYSPNFLGGNMVIVVNAKHIRVSGKKWKEKVYDKYSGYPDGRREITLERLMEKNPAKVIQYAVKGMLPKTILGRKMLQSLKVYSGQTHPHSALEPLKIEV